MADETIEIDVNVNAEGAEGKFKSLRTEIKETKIELQKAQEAGDNVRFNKLKNDLDELEDKLELTTLKSKKFDDALAGLPGPVGRAGQALKGLDGTMKLLAANPIVAGIAALAAVLTTVIAAMKQTKEGTAALTGVMDAFGNVFRPIVTFVSDVGVKAFTALGDAINWAATKLGLVDEEQVKAKENFRQLETSIKSTNAALENEIAILEAQGASIDKIAAKKKEQIDNEIQLLQLKKQAFGEITADEEAKIIELEGKKKVIDAGVQKYNKDQAEKRKEERKKELLEQVSGYREAFAARLENTRKFFQDEKFELDKQLAEGKITQQEYQKALLENERAFNQERLNELALQRNAELAKLKEGRDSGLLTEKEYQDAAVALVNEYNVNKNTAIKDGQATELADLKQASADRIAVLKEEQRSREAIQDSLVDTVAGAGRILSSLAGDNKALAIAGIILEQGAALGKVLIDTARGISAATAAAAPFISNPLTTVAATANLARTIAQLKITAGLSAAGIIAGAAKGIAAVNKAQIPGQKGGGGGGGAASTGGAQAATPAFTTPAIGAPVIGASAAQQGQLTGIVAGALSANNSQTQPIRAYVVGNEIRTQQQLDRRIRTAARLGG